MTAMAGITVRLLLLASVLGAAEFKGVVLAIGNSEYPAAPLSTPPNDAGQFGVRLHQLGFDVETKTNVRFTDFRALISQLRARATTTAGSIIFYYAGHGIQINRVNYLIPIRFEL